MLGQIAGFSNSGTMPIPVLLSGIIGQAARSLRGDSTSSTAFGSRSAP